MENTYILNFKYEISYPIIIPRNYICCINYRKSIINKPPYDETLITVVSLDYDDIILQIESKDYDYPKEDIKIEYLDPDHIHRMPLCLSLPLLDHPITLNDYNTLPRSCDCIECGNPFVYPHVILKHYEGKITKFDNNHCKACTVSSIDNYFNASTMNVERAYYLGVCYANMTYVYPDNGYIILHVVGDLDLLTGLLSSIGIDRKITKTDNNKNSDYYILLQTQQYYYDLCDIGFNDNNSSDDIDYAHSSLDVPSIPESLYGSFVSGFIRNSPVFMRGDRIYIGVEYKSISRMIMDQMRLDGVECWEEYCNRMMCVVYRKNSHNTPIS